MPPSGTSRRTTLRRHVLGPRSVAGKRLEKKDFYKAAAIRQRSIFQYLPSPGYPTDSYGSTIPHLVSMTCDVHRQRACGLVAAGQVEEALKERKRR